MRTFRDWLGLPIYGLMLAGLLLIPYSLRHVEGVSEEECVDLWNSTPNTGPRALVVAEDFRFGTVEATFSEGRYEGCLYTFGDRPDRGRWLRFSSSRIPGESEELRMEGPSRGLGLDSRTPLESLDHLNLLVLSDGSLKGTWLTP